MLTSPHNRTLATTQLATGKPLTDDMAGQKMGGNTDGGEPKKGRNARKTKEVLEREELAASVKEEVEKKMKNAGVPMRHKTAPETDKFATALETDEECIDPESGMPTDCDSLVAPTNAESRAMDEERRSQKQHIQRQQQRLAAKARREHESQYENLQNGDFGDGTVSDASSKSTEPRHVGVDNALKARQDAKDAQEQATAMAALMKSAAAASTQADIEKVKRQIQVEKEKWGHTRTERSNSAQMAKPPPIVITAGQHGDSAADTKADQMTADQIGASNRAAMARDKKDADRQQASNAREDPNKVSERVMFC
jgi:hypothetical protein